MTETKTTNSKINTSMAKQRHQKDRGAPEVQGQELEEGDQGQDAPDPEAGDV